VAGQGLQLLRLRKNHGHAMDWSDWNDGRMGLPLFGGIYRGQGEPFKQHPQNNAGLQQGKVLTQAIAGPLDEGQELHRRGGGGKR
jgi:hypothetical protein